MTAKRTRGQPSLGPRTPLTVRLPNDLLATLHARAAAHGRSTNAELVEILRAVLSGTPERVAEAYTRHTMHNAPLTYVKPEHDQ